MKLACIEAGQLLQRREAGLSGAEGLRLEDHLSGCDDCRAQASLLAGLSQLSAADFKPLTTAVRQRLITRALHDSQRAAARPKRAARTGFVLPLLAASAAAALVGWLWLRPGPRPEPEALAVNSAPAEAQSRVLSGEVTLSGTTRTPGQSLLSRAHMQTRDGAVVQLAHATVELRADSAAAWDAGARKLELTSGSVMVEVDPAKHQPFAVVTSRFVVHVLGTRFEVTPQRVRVLRGRVLVQPTAASAAITLDASDGETEYQVPEPAPDAVDAGAPVAASRPRPSDDASELLERARTQLSTRALTQARHTLKLALARSSTRAQRAEALSLQAEGQLLSGDYRGARDGYLRVVSQLPHEPAAETALYAAARIEAEHGDPARARTLLVRYRTRYPHGSFVREAERRESALGAAP